jgi:2-oxoisovalerate dehydrogenase E2 component (dihydrolipoyl transacylase)
MSRFVFRMPDLGEGTVEAEVVEWKVKVGDVVHEDQVIAEVMTDKAAVEVPSPVSGRVLSLTGNPGDMVAVGSELIVFDTSGEAPAEAAPVAGEHVAAAAVADAPTAPATAATPAGTPAATAHAGRVMASPATRRRAREAGIDLSGLAGSGPGGRIQPADLEAALAGKSPAAPGRGAPATRLARSGTEEIKVIGVRRVIAHDGGQAQHSALRLRRGSRHH